MITICEECGKKYRIDADKISGTEAKFKCKDCGHLITVSKPLAAPEAVKDATPVFPKFPELDNAKAVEKEPGPPQPPEAKKADKKKIRPAFMRPPKIRFGLTAKLFTMMIIVSLVPLSMFWGITLKQTRARMQTDAKKHFNQTSISIAKQIDEWLDNNARILKTLANMEDIISMNRLRQEPLLQVIHRVYPWIYFTATIDTKGMNIARNDDRPLLDYSNTNFFQEVIGGKPIAWQIVTEESSKNPAFFFAVPIIRHDEIVGVVANAVRLSDISKLMTFWGGDDTGTAFLVDQKGKVIAHKMTNYVLQQKSLLQHPLVAAYRNGQRGAVLFTGEGGNSILGHVRGTALGWILAIQQEEK
ncbi:MAG: zinc-ribbon domain-containing protein, partial [Proteobacteria bacterium]|nr:zinc-ribbon domain-containing protein [Pseudomonadota bacterium]